MKVNSNSDRVLTDEENERLLDHCPPHTKSVVKLSYHTGMHQGEILNLSMSQIDLKEGFIYLNPKTKECRMIPLNNELIKMIKGFSTSSPDDKVFKYRGSAIGSIKKSFSTACKKAGIDNFTFSGLSRMAVINWCFKGHSYSIIAAVTGHKDTSGCKRLTPIKKEELKALVV